MKTKHPHITKTPALLLAVLTLAAGAAAAQTTLFYSNTGSGSNAFAGAGASAGNLASIGYDSWQYNALTTGTSDGGTIGTRPFLSPVAPALYQNYQATALPGTVAGMTLESVTLYLFAEAINPNGQPIGSTTFSVYEGLNGTGSLIQPLPLASNLDPGFFAVTLTAAQFAGGFSITATGLSNTALLNVSTEENLTALQTPGLSATYNLVPEPSVAVLGAVGALALLRRRRA